MTSTVTTAAIEVHKEKGPGLLESIYEKCMMRELELRHTPAVNRVIVSAEYKGFTFEEPLKLDVNVEQCPIVELKEGQDRLAIHKAQLLSYMNLSDAPPGLLVKFRKMAIKGANHRLILKGANRS